MKTWKILGLAAIALLAIVAVIAAASNSGDDSDQPLSFTEKVESLQYDNVLSGVPICPFYNARLKEFHNQKEQLRELKRSVRSETLGSLDQKRYRELLRRENEIADLKWRLGIADDYNERVSEYLQLGWNRKIFKTAGLPVKITPYEWCTA